MSPSSTSLRVARDLRSLPAPVPVVGSAAALSRGPRDDAHARALDFDPDVLVRTAARARVTKIGRWSIVTKLATGGMGDIFLAASEAPAGFRRLVAIKRLRDELACDPLIRGMFMDEARLAARLRHPNLVAALELADDGLCPYYVMEWLEGRTLAEIIAAAAQCGVWPDPRFFVHVIARALAGLHHAHELRDDDGTPLGVVHRDVSPHNILVTFHGDVRLIDFGVADFAAPAPRSRTRQSVFAGKRGYVAPEHVAGQRIDRRADVFAMGVVTWEVLARRLIGKPSRVQRSGRRAHAPVSAFARGVDARLDRIVARAVAIDPSERYPSALAMQMALERWLARTEQTVTPREIGTLVSAYFEEEKRDLQALVRADAIAAREDTPPPSNAFWGSLPSVKSPPPSRSRPIIVPAPPERPRESARDTSPDLGHAAPSTDAHEIARVAPTPADASIAPAAAAPRPQKDAKRTKKSAPMSLPVNALRARSLVAPALTPESVRSLLVHATRIARMGVVLVTLASALAAICLIALALR